MHLRTPLQRLATTARPPAPIRPTLLFNTISDPCSCVQCVVAEDELNPGQLRGMSSAHHLQFHHTSSSIPVAASVPRWPFHQSTLHPYKRPWCKGFGGVGGWCIWKKNPVDISLVPQSFLPCTPSMPQSSVSVGVTQSIKVAAVVRTQARV